jgi:hypothetical protein
MMFTMLEVLRYLAATVVFLLAGFIFGDWFRVHYKALHALPFKINVTNNFNSIPYTFQRLCNTSACMTKSTNGLLIE